MKTKNPNIDARAASKGPIADKGSGAAAGIASRRIPVAIAVALTLLSGVVHGYLDGRWSRPIDLRAQGDQLAELPERMGDWVLTESTPLDEGAAKMLRCYGSQVRLYHNEKNNAMVTVAVLFGPRGPIAVHTPEVCYSSAGTKQVGQTRVEKITTSQEEHRMWSAQFAQRAEADASLDVWYGWSDGGAFAASKYPRVWMTESLYKIQVAGPVGNESQRPCRDFLEAFLPSVERVIQ
ncbi:exosortase-associated EpsI family protein [Novipirellula sp.]|uniref:exosortase-associated EpsI family protein n=1 Tax=Novipirellula sp. TaxID=2795430 RepID=UPI003568A676